MVLVCQCDTFIVIVLIDEPRQNQGRGLVDRKLVKAPPPPPPPVILLLTVPGGSSILAVGDFRCGVPLCIVIPFIKCDKLWDFGPYGGTWAKLGFLHNLTCSYVLGILVNF